MNRRNCFRFGPFRLDVDNGILFREGQAIPLPPKAFELLDFLCRGEGRLISKLELLDGVWRNRVVTEGVLKTTVQELRRALGDDSKAPRYIETVHRRGYRFIAQVAADEGGGENVNPPRESSIFLVGDDDSMVGRARFKEALGASLKDAIQGKTSIVFIRGEPGAGKTTLIRSFMKQVGAPVSCVLGQCVDQYGSVEPYLPLLEAIGQLAREAGRDCVLQLRQYAPSWLSQLPWLIDEAERDKLQREIEGTNKQRMLRELGEFLRNWTRSRPVLLVIEDLHWSDHATLDAITFLSRRGAGCRVMVLGSYRPVDVLLNKHPFKGVLDGLLLHGLCDDLALDALSRGDVECYLARRFLTDDLPATMIDAVYKRTEGLPLFLVQLADEMAAGRERHETFEQSLARLPEGLRHLIDLQFDRLDTNGQRCLEVAAVCGEEFSVSILAGVTGGALLETESWCDVQARSQNLLQKVEKSGDKEGNYRFIHAYYRERAYARLPAARKSALHGRVGEWMECSAGGHPDAIAAELAMHFELGTRPDKAIKYLRSAALSALGRHAAEEAGGLLQRCLVLFDTELPDTIDHRRLKLDALKMLASVLLATRGYAAPELAALHQRCLKLAESLDDKQAQFSALYGIWTSQSSLGNLTLSMDLARQLMAVADASDRAAQSMVANLAMGTTWMFMGENIAADACFEAGLAFGGESSDSSGNMSRVFGQDPAAALLALRAVVRNLRGHDDHALALMKAARERADEIEHPYTQAFVLMCTAWLHRDRGEPEKVRDYLPRFEKLSEMHGFPAMLNTTLSFQGWVAAILEGDAEGVVRIEQATQNLNKSGIRLTKSLYLYHLADAYRAVGRVAAGLAALDEALHEIGFSGERRYESESWRLRGELLLETSADETEMAAGCFNRAIGIARRQGAKRFEVRAAISLADMLNSRGRANEAVATLQAACEQCDLLDFSELKSARSRVVEFQSLQTVVTTTSERNESLRVDFKGGETIPPSVDSSI